jgi:hypothetical protein
MDALGAAITDLAGLMVAKFAPSLTESDLGLLSSVLAGTAAALAVAIALTLALRLRLGGGTWRGVAKGSFAALAALALTGFVGYDMRHAALDYLGLNASRPAVEFEIKLPPHVAATSAGRDTQIELHTDRNQTLAKGVKLDAGDGGGPLLRGSLPLDFRTANRTMILSLAGQPQHLFKLRLAANPSRSPQFGPWLPADRVVSTMPAVLDHAAPNDGYAIRYRVI